MMGLFWFRAAEDSKDGFVGLERFRVYVLGSKVPSLEADVVLSRRRLEVNSPFDPHSGISVLLG